MANGDNQQQLNRLNALIQNLQRDIQLTGNAASRNVSESLLNRGISGRLTQDRSSEARERSTLGLQRELLRLQNRREDLQQAQQSPSAQSQSNNLQSLINSFGGRAGSRASQRSQGPTLTIRNLTGPNSRDPRLALEIPGATNIRNFSSLGELQADLRRRGLQDANLQFAGPGETTPELVSQLRQANIPFVSGQQRGGALSFINRFSSLASRIGTGGRREQADQTSDQPTTSPGEAAEILTRREQPGAGTRFFQGLTNLFDRTPSDQQQLTENLQRNLSEEEFTLRQQAEEAIARGADPQRVIQRLNEALGRE